MSTKRRYCAVCNCVLPTERIEADSKTRLCVKHAEEIKKYGGEFIGTGQYGSLGKTESLKKNYGDVSVTWKRNEDGLNRLLDDYDAEKRQRTV